MFGYAATAATATEALLPFEDAPLITNPGGLLEQAVAAPRPAPQRSTIPHTVPPPPPSPPPPALPRLTCQSEVTDPNEDAADPNSAASPSQATAAANIGAEPAPVNIRNELSSGGNTA